MNLMTFDDSLPSNFELLHLSYDTLMDDEMKCSGSLPIIAILFGKPSKEPPITTL